MKKIKSILRKLYQLIIMDSLRFCYLLKTKWGDKSKVYKTFSLKNKHVFFGYYDICPFNKDETKLLSMVIERDNSSLNDPFKIDVGYFEITGNNQEFIKIGETNSWCWQQGCRLQWYPLNNAHDFIIYNKLVSNKHGCIIQNVKTKKIIKEINFPIYSVTSDGNFGISLNFSRLHRLRPGYGYVNFKDITQNDPAPVNDGIKLIDINKGSWKFLFSVKDITVYKSNLLMENSIHYFNHVLFNPSGSLFLFFHIWLKGNKRFVRMLVSDLAGNIKGVFGGDSFVSHYNWRNDNEILVYASTKESGEAYYLYNVGSGKTEIVGKGILTEDGHPSFLNDNKTIVTDTYPDKYRFQHLLEYNLDDNRLKVLRKFQSPLSFKGEVRLDLHPRISPSNKYVCIDFVKSGKRALNVLLLGK